MRSAGGGQIDNFARSRVCLQTLAIVNVKPAPERLLRL
jgi:hypothetical protein